MGWGYYLLTDGREAGYDVSAECDAVDCHEAIDRGLGYLCGTLPESISEDGCGYYFCTSHDGNHGCTYGYCSGCDATRDLSSSGQCYSCLDEFNGE